MIFDATRPDAAMPSSTGDNPTILQTRERVGQMRRLARTADEQDGVELFGALCGFLDELYGPPGFDRLLRADQRPAVASMITKLRSGDPFAGQQTDDQELEMPRLEQPVNAAVTLAEGRELARRLARAGDWQAGLGIALMALYEYLDELYGGPGAFTELLNADERDWVAERVARLPR